MKVFAFFAPVFFVLIFFSDIRSQDITSATYDFVIKNARLVDGTGNPWFKSDIGIKNGRISRIGIIKNEDAKQILDAKNQIVAPGFIDVHAHTENIFNHPEAENFIRMGVTTLITGNCGGSVTDVGKFFGRFETTPLTVNLATLIAHGSVRAQVMGTENRAPSPDELVKMKQIVDQAMRDGAVGISTGLIYVPGTYAKTDEVIDLTRVAHKYRGVYASHIRDEGENVFEAISEAINVGEKTGIPVQISHFKISSKKNWGKTDETLGLVRAAREKGLVVTVDQYAYTASSTSLDTILPSWALENGREEGRKRLNDLPTRKKIIDEIKTNLKNSKFKDFSYAYVANYSANKELNGMNIKEIAKKAKGKDDLKTQIDQILEIYAGGGAQMVYRKMNEKDVQNIMRAPFTMIASDSGVRSLGEGVPHPRGYGNNARVLGRYVRELNLITLEDAVRKMTSLPAQTFNLKNRGLIKEGFAADLVIFDDKTISDKATFENPHQYPLGITNVFVNGKLVVSDGRITENRPGIALRLNETR